MVKDTRNLDEISERVKLEVQEEIGAGFHRRSEKKAKKKKLSETYDYPRPEKTIKDSPELQSIARKFTSLFKEKFPDEQLYWAKKEWSQAKMFLAKVGDVKKSVKIIEMIFGNWPYYCTLWKIAAPVPSMGIILGFGVSLRTGIFLDDDKKISDKELKEKPWLRSL